MQRKAKNRQWWWGNGLRDRDPAKTQAVERLVRAHRRTFQLEILEERNLLAGDSLGAVVQTILASSSSPNTTPAASDASSPSSVADPGTISINLDSGESNFSVNAATILPAVTYYQGPAGVTAPGQAFNPTTANISFTSTIASGAPTISEWTRTANPDNSISIAGDSFSASSTGPTQFYVFSESGTGPGQITMITTQSATTSSAIATLPSTNFPTNSMYMIWANDNNGVGTPVFINQTETWWVGPDAAQAGQIVSVYGQNLSQTGVQWTQGVSSGTAPTWVWIVPNSGGPAQAVTVTQSNPYQVSFQLPSTVTAGQYTVWVHNGRGGAYGWGAPLQLTVRSPAANGTSWTGPTYSVSNSPALQQMVTSGPSVDATSLLQSVLNQAGASTTGNATVVLPAGTFEFANPLYIPSNVRLIGQGMNQTILKAIPGNGTSFQSLGLLCGAPGTLSSTNVSIQNLTLNSGYNPLGATDPAYTGGIQNLVRMFNATDVSFTGVRFDSKSAEAFEIYQGYRITVNGCDFQTANGAFSISAAKYSSRTPPLNSPTWLHKLFIVLARV